MAEEEPKKRKGNKLLIGLVIFTLLASGGAAGYFYLSANSGDLAEDGTEKAPPVEIVEPIFVKVGPMTVNIRSHLGDRLLYISMMVKVKDETTEKFLKKQMPDINNRLLILLSQQTAESLTAVGGKEIAAENILAALNRPFSDPQPELGIESVLFQDFIVQ
jgi:flagellar FliL protein